MKIYIPTRGRPNRQPVLNALIRANITSAILVLSKDDPALSDYGRLGGCSRIVVKAANIAEKRQAILEHAGGQPFCMIDDDLRFYHRSFDGKKFFIAEEKNLVDLLNNVRYWLEKYAHVGLSDKFMAQTKPRRMVTHGRYNQFLAYNPKLFPKPAPKFRLITNQEHDFHLQLATRGRPPCILTEYSKNATFYSKGGCSHYRTPAVERKAFKQMADLWPDYVKLVKTDRRPGLRMQVAWKKAAESAL